MYPPCTRAAGRIMINDFSLHALNIVYAWLIENEGAHPLRSVEDEVNHYPRPDGPWNRFADAITEKDIVYWLRWRVMQACRPYYYYEIPTGWRWGIFSDAELEALLE